MNRFNFYSELLFPFHFMALGTAFLLGGLASVIFSPFLGVILIIIGLLIVTAYRGLEFDRLALKYRVYNSFIFIRVGKWESYQEVKQIFVKTNIISQTIYLKISQGTDISNVVFDAYLEFSDEEKVYLVGKKKKMKIMKKIEPLSKFLGVQINDLTEN
ncbi:MAG: hypothetical protein KDC58_06535 [Cyclobacteriaceae bacterium]|nr:hypothetical protein [Cyclobacteriaceae bacterium]